MKTILEFEMPEEKEELHYALNGVSYSSVITELDNWLRSKVKYEDIETIKVSEVRSKLSELLAEYITDTEYM